MTRRPYTAVRGDDHPAVIHFERVRAWLRDRLAKDSEVVRVVFDETEALREWYKNGTRRSRPQSWQSGYLFAYAPLGYDRLDKLASLVPALAQVLQQSSEGAVMGCGPCPELWSISRRTAPGGLRLALFDEFLDDWSDVIDGFTRPLVEASLNRASIAMPDLGCGEAGLDAFERIQGRVDFILAQQCLNEQVGGAADGRICSARGSRIM